MTDPAEDMMRAWREFTSRLGPPGSEDNDIARAMLGPMQQQATFFGEALRMYGEEQRKVRQQLLQPLSEMLGQFEDVATSLRASGEALVRAGELMDQQATAMEGAVRMAKELRRTMSWPLEPGTDDAEEAQDGEGRP